MGKMKELIMDHDEFRRIIDADQHILDSFNYTMQNALPVGKQNEQIGTDYQSQVEAMQKSSKLYTPPPVEYVEPVEDLYDWDTGKIRE